jgi:mono/diheme cytochrome c family protein
MNRKEMNVMKTIAILLGIGLLVIAGEAAYGADKPAGEAQGLFEKKCSTCHSTSRTTSQKKTAREWERTVSRMKNSLGAQLTDQEATAIVEYLSKNHGE